MRFWSIVCLVLFGAFPAFAESPPSACEGQNPTLIKQGCSAILDAGQTMQSLDFEAYNNRALAELSLQEPQTAAQDAQAAIALNPNNGPAHLTLARAYLALNEPEKALDEVSKAVLLNPYDSGAYVLLGELQLARGDWQASITEQNRALQLASDNADAYIARAMAEIQGNNIKAAWADVNQAASLGSTDPRIHLVRGLAAVPAQSWQVVVAEETQFLAQGNPSIYAAYALPALSQAQLNLGNPKAALGSINRAIALFPETLNFYTERAIIEAALEQFQPAITDLTTVIKAASSTKAKALVYRSLILRAGAYQSLKQYEKAKADLIQAVSLAPKQPDAYAALASVERSAGDLDAAVQADQQAITLDPENTSLYTDLSTLHDAQHNYAAAAADEAAILKIQPHSALDLNNRCWFLALDGKLNDALGYCQQALKIAPHDAATLDSTGFVYLRLNDNQQAIHYYDLALKADPQLASSLYGRGLAEQKLGETKEAAADIALAKKYDPDIESDFAS